MTVTIYNRWGQKVFETDLEKAEWDGNNLTGEEEIKGTYFYVLKGQGQDGYRYEEKGTIILIK